MTNYLSIFTILAAVCACIIAGVFFAFATFVMPALKAIPARDAVSAMQSINIVVVKSLFMFVFMGALILSIGLGIFALMHWGKPGMLWLLVGSVLYIFGSFGVTALFNVPLNDALATANLSAAENAWAQFYENWTLWNSVRTVASLLSSVAFIYAALITE